MCVCVFSFSTKAESISFQHLHHNVCMCYGYNAKDMQCNKLDVRTPRSHFYGK